VAAPDGLGEGFELLGFSRKRQPGSFRAGRHRPPMVIPTAC
jgi:hypothetical protein